MVRRAIDAGAVPVIGGGRPQHLDKGWFVDPVLCTVVSPEIEIHQEEVVGPVGIVLTYDTIDEAVALAKGSRFGLSGTVFGDDVDRAVSVASRIDTGMVEVSGNPAGLAASPLRRAESEWAGL